MYADYKYRHLACASKRKAPEGFEPYNGMSQGLESREAWCHGQAGHIGDHETMVLPVEGYDGHNAKWIRWENKGMPSWLTRVGIHALRMLKLRTPGYGPVIDTLITEMESQTAGTGR